MSLLLNVTFVADVFLCYRYHALKYRKHPEIVIPRLPKQRFCRSFFSTPTSSATSSEERLHIAQHQQSASNIAEIVHNAQAQSLFADEKEIEADQDNTEQFRNCLSSDAHMFFDTDKNAPLDVNNLQQDRMCKSEEVIKSWSSSRALMKRADSDRVEKLATKLAQLAADENNKQNEKNTSSDSAIGSVVSLTNSSGGFSPAGSGQSVLIKMNRVKVMESVLENIEID